MATAKQNGSQPNTDLADQIAVLREDVGQLAETLSGLVGSSAKGAASAARAQAAETYTRGKAAVGAARDKTGETVREHPFAALLVALGVGFLIGIFSRRS